MMLRLKNVSEDERHAAWTRIVERISREQEEQAWSHYMFRLLRAVFDKNGKLSNEGGFVFDWIAENYVHTALMLLRRELDQQAGTENIRNLLNDIIQHPAVLTRARYRSAWGDEGRFDREQADRAFDSFKPKRVDGDPDADYMDPDVVRADLDQMMADAGRLREHAERTAAHRTPERNIDTSAITFQALHQAITDVRGVVAKYYALLTLKVFHDWEPVPQFDTIAPFTKPWIVDPESVAAIAQDCADE